MVISIHIYKVYPMVQKHHTIYITKSIPYGNNIPYSYGTKIPYPYGTKVPYPYGTKVPDII